jgi:hypothetical protein
LLQRKKAINLVNAHQDNQIIHLQTKNKFPVVPLLKKAMRYIVLWAGLLLSCQAEKEFEGTYTDFEDVNFVTLTNESTDGGSQIAYLKNGYSANEARFCFCDQSCSRNTVEVAELQFNEGTTQFRYKVHPSDGWTLKSSTDWCTKYD